MYGFAVFSVPLLVRRILDALRFGFGKECLGLLFSPFPFWLGESLTDASSFLPNNAHLPEIALNAIVNRFHLCVPGMLHFANVCHGLPLRTPSAPVLRPFLLSHIRHAKNVPCFASSFFLVANEVVHGVVDTKQVTCHVIESWHWHYSLENLAEVDRPW